MTRQGSFKRAVRQRARETGQRYTEARADLEIAERQAFIRTRPYERDELRAHLEEHHGISITSLAPIDDDPATRPRGSWPGHYASTLMVRRADGPPWIARVHSSSADRVDRVRGDAEVLRFLAEQEFPAERIATQEPVSVHAGGTVIVTSYLEGGRPADLSHQQGIAVQRELGSLLGRLHTLPAGEGALARDGGAEETDGGFHVGRPKEDLAAAMEFLVSVEDQVPAEGRAGFEYLRDHVEGADDAEGLPEAFTHSNFHAWSVVGRPGQLSVVGWADSGRGPRLPTLGWLLRTSAEVSDEHVDAALAGYRDHVQLSQDELERLPGALNLRPLWLACLEYRQLVRNGTIPTMTEGWTGWRPEQAERLTDRVRSALGSSS